MSAEQSVHVHAFGGSDDQSSHGGWAVVLTYGELQKEFAGAEAETTAEMMAWRAVSEGLSRLNRRTRVDLCVDFDDPPDDPVLDALLERHDVIWGMGRDNCDDEVACELADRLAHHHMRGLQVTTREPLSRMSTIATALNAFLSERWHDRYAFEQADDIFGTLKFSIGWYSGKTIQETPVVGLPAYLAEFFHRTLPHNQAAEPGEIRAAAQVVRELLEWLHDRDLIGRDAAREWLAETTEIARQDLGVHSFLAACEEFLPRLSDRFVEERHHLSRTEIELVGPQMITFSGYGSIPVPPLVATLAQEGWTLFVSVAKVRGQWYLEEAVGDL